MIHKITVTLAGCDDVTRMKMEVNDTQLEFFKKLSALSKLISKSACQPRLLIKTGDIEEDEYGNIIDEDEQHV